MNIIEIIRTTLLTVLTVILAIMAIVAHRIGTIRKWELEKEREARNQPEFWDENAV